jgi:GT2 family glycosyltransferase
VNPETQPRASMNKAAQKFVLISVLNWNTASITLECIRSLLALDDDPSIVVRIVVIDNGSAQSDWNLLNADTAALPVTLVRHEVNLGFAGGHNIAIQMAIDEKADFIWLVNSDAVVDRDCLGKLVQLMTEHPDCGAASPVTVAADDPTSIDFCGAKHDWKQLESVRATSIDEARAWEVESPEAMWVRGTVVLYRVEALKQIGSLDTRLFAYYEDDDIGARLSKAGWSSRMAFDARSRHVRFPSDETHRPPYFFYLMARNGLRFWLTHTPTEHRRWIRLRLIDRSMFMANILVSKSRHDKAQACLLGIADGMRGTGGPPVLERKVPPHIELLRKVLMIQHAKHLANKL